MLRLLITAIVCLFASHCGADEILGTNPKMTLRPPAPKPAPVLGIPFGSSFQDANIALTRLGLKLVGRETLDDNGKAHLLTFDHLPESLLAGTGKLQILFYDNRLIRAKFDFDPTYHNFLLTRERLIAQLGDRYSVEKEQAQMERMLQSHLAALPKGGFDKEAEDKIKESIVHGHTFFVYQIKDQQNLMSAALAYYATGRPNEKEPTLQVHLGLKQDSEAFDAYMQELKKAKER